MRSRKTCQTSLKFHRMTRYNAVGRRTFCCSFAGNAKVIPFLDVHRLHEAVTGKSDPSPASDNRDTAAFCATGDLK